jgi:hypothetical protein
MESFRPYRKSMKFNKIKMLCCSLGVVEDVETVLSLEETQVWQDLSPNLVLGTFSHDSPKFNMFSSDDEKSQSWLYGCVDKYIPINFVRFQFFWFDLEMMQKYGFVQVTIKDTDFIQLKNSWNCEKITALLFL